MAARLNKSGSLRSPLAPALAVAMFVTARYSMSFVHVAQGISSFWLAHGLALAVLLRTSQRQWPVLIIAAMAGNVAAAILAQSGGPFVIATRSAAGALQYGLCAYVLRRRLGDYFDLIEPRHLMWFGAVGAISTILKIGVQIALLGGSAPSGRDLIEWIITNFLGLLVLSLPLLAISSRSAVQDARIDRYTFLLFAALIAELWIVFGPIGFPALYAVMPVLLLLAWRSGLLGAGVGTLITVILTCLLNGVEGGLAHKLIVAGYTPSERGTYLELFFSVAILTSLPLAVARTRQRTTDAALSGALAAAESRAAQLAESEATARASEAALVTNENRWRAALEGSGLAVWDWNMTTNTGHYSGVWKSMLGFGEDEIGASRTEWANRIHPDDLPGVIAAMDAHSDGSKAIYESEHRILCKDGSYKWMLDRGMIVERAPDGAPLRLIGTNAEIDAIKQAAVRAERHGRLYLALAACNAALGRRGSIEELADRICEILVTSSRMRLAWVGLVDSDSGMFESIGAYGADQGFAYNVSFEISARAEHPRGDDAMARAFRADEPLWIDDFASDSRSLPLSDRALTHSWRGAAMLPLRRRGEPIAVLAMYTDEVGFFDEDARTLLYDMASQFSLAIDALDAEVAARQFQESLSASEQRFRAMFEASPFGIALMDTVDGNFLTVNSMFETIVGWTAEELMERRWQEITHPEDLTPDAELATQFIGGKISGYQFEKRYLRKDGEVVWVHMTIARFALPDSGAEQHLCMIEDITDRKALESRIHFVQQMESIGQLTGGVAHDFNNLLTIVIGSSETLTGQLADPQQRRLANLILQAAEQGGELIRRLLAFARRQPLEPQPFDVDALLESMVELIKSTLGSDLQFSIDTGAGLRPAFADPSQTESAILNLCLNARDAMPHGGTLIIQTESISLKEDYVRRHPDARPGDYTAIRVSDTGSGIAPDVIERIFEPFFTTKETGKGSGLGLSMVYGFVQQSQGYIDLSSELGKGTTFTLYLPVADTDADMIAPPCADGAEIARGSENVLIVEDNDLVREHVRSQFESLGYQVTVASTGAEALTVLEQKDDIDLLFTDVVMPGGMDGRQLAERAVEHWPWLRVLYTSGYSKDALTQDGRLLDDVTLLSKPYSKRELSEKARKVLDEVP